MYIDIIMNFAKAATFIINILLSAFSATTINLFLSIISTLQVISNIFTAI